MLLDPSGKLLSIGTAKREIAVDDPRLSRLAADAEPLFQRMHLSVVCVHCGSGIRFGNHESDTHWRAECECAVRRFVNPRMQH